METGEQAKFYDGFLPHFEAQVNNDRNVGFRQLTRYAIRSFCRTPSPVVFDVGCAFGYNSEYIHRECPGSTVYGIDLSPNSIRVAQERFPHGNWFCGDVTTFRVDEGLLHRVDLFLVSDALEHIPRVGWPALVDLLYALAADGAVLVLSFPCPEAPNTMPQPVEEKVALVPLITLLSEVFGLLLYADRPYPYQRLVLQRR